MGSRLLEILTTHLSPQEEDNDAADFSPCQEGTSPTLVTVPNPVFGSQDAFCEPFDVRVGLRGLGEGPQGPVSVQPLTNSPPRRTRSWRRTSPTPRGPSQSSDAVWAEAEARAGERRLLLPRVGGTEGAGPRPDNKGALSGCGPCPRGRASSCSPCRAGPSRVVPRAAGACGGGRR